MKQFYHSKKNGIINGVIISCKKFEKLSLSHFTSFSMFERDVSFKNIGKSRGRGLV